jgi:hypothetical protein
MSRRSTTTSTLRTAATKDPAADASMRILSGHRRAAAAPSNLPPRGAASQGDRAASTVLPAANRAAPTPRNTRPPTARKAPRAAPAPRLPRANSSEPAPASGSLSETTTRSRQPDHRSPALPLGGTRDSPAYPRFAAAWCRKQQWRDGAAAHRRPCSDSTDHRARCYEPEEGSCPRCCWTALVGVGRRRPCRDSTPVARRVTRVFAIRPILRRWKRSSRSCAPLATIPTAAGGAV